MSTTTQTPMLMVTRKVKQLHAVAAAEYLFNNNIQTIISYTDDDDGLFSTPWIFLILAVPTAEKNGLDEQKIFVQP